MSYVRVDTGVIQFKDPRTGAPLRHGRVYTRDQTTQQLVTTFQNQSGSIENQQKIVLDIFGECKIFYNNLLTFEVYDAAGAFITRYENVGALSPGDPTGLPILLNDSTQLAENALLDGDLFIVLDKTTREEKGVVIPGVFSLNGAKNNGNILGVYSTVKSRFAATGSAIQDGAIVIGDTNGYRYQLNIGGDPSINPESDVFDSFSGVGTHWTNLEIKSTNASSYHWQNRDFYTDSGAANSYVLSSASPNNNVESYDTGMAVAFIGDNVNTGPAVVNIDGVGSKAIVDANGDALIGNEISVTQYNFMRYDDINDRFVLLAGGGGAAATDLGFQIDGLVFTADPGDGLTTPFENVIINPGRCMNDTWQFLMELPVAISKKFADTYSEGPGGGMKPTTVTLSAGKMCAIFLMAKPDGTLDIGLDETEDATKLKAAAPDYTFFRRLLWLPAYDATTYCDITQTGDDFRIGKYTATALVYTAVSISAGGSASANVAVGAPPNTVITGQLTENTLVPTTTGGFWSSSCDVGVVPTWATLLGTFRNQLKVDTINGSGTSYDWAPGNVYKGSFQCEVDENAEIQWITNQIGQDTTGQFAIVIFSWNDRRMQDGVLTPNEFNHYP